MRRYLTTRRGQGREDSGEVPSLVRNVPLFGHPKTSLAKPLNASSAENGPTGGRCDWRIPSSSLTIPCVARMNLPPPTIAQDRYDCPVGVAKLFIGAESEYITKMLTNRVSNAFSRMANATSRNPHPESSGRMAGSIQLSKSAVRAARNSRLTGA